MVAQSHEQIMPATERQKTIRILGVPMDLGAGRRGVDMGPSAVRYARLQDRLVRLGCVIHDSGNVIVPPVEELKNRQADDAGSNIEIEQGKAHHLNEVVKVCQSVYEAVSTYEEADEFTIVLGGDHSISVGSVAGIANGRSIGVIWVDAHADYNTPETTPSGNVHGMPVAALLGDGPAALVNVGYPGAKLKPSQVVMVGIRNLDFKERQRLANS